MKKFAIAVAVLIALLLAAPFLIPAETYKNEIVARIEAATGRTLTIDGELRLRFLPMPGITANKLTLSNPPGFGDAPFITLEALTIDVALMPLLQKRVEVRNFTLDRPEIRLVAKGNANNWTFASTAVKNEGPAAAAPEKSGGNPVALAGIGDVEIEAGQLTYIKDGKNIIDLKELDLSTSLSAMNAPLYIDGSAQWNGKRAAVKATLDSPQAWIDRGPVRLEAALASEALTLSLGGAYEKERFGGKVAASSPSLKTLAAWIDPGRPPLAIPATLALDLSGELGCGGQECTMEKASLTLDAIKAAGTIRVAMAGSRPRVDSRLTAGMLDLNPFLPAEKSADAGGLLIASALAQAPARWSAEPIDLSGLNAVNGRHAIQAEGLRLRQWELGKPRLTMTLENGALALRVEEAQAYGGALTLALAADAAGHYGLSGALRDVQSEPLLKAAAGFDRINGAASLNFDTNASGRSVRDIVHSLSGTARLSMPKGVFKGVDLNEMARNLPAAFQDTGGARRTEFSDLGGNFTIQRGVISNNDLAMKTAALRLSGQGMIDLPAYGIDYRLSPQLISAGKDAAGATVEKQGLVVPVLVQGPLDRPGFQPDLASAVQNALQDPRAFKEQLRNSKGSLKEQLKEPKETIRELKGLLKGLKNGQ